MFPARQARRYSEEKRTGAKSTRCIQAMGLRTLITQEAVLNLIGLTTDSVPQKLLTFTQVLTDTAFAFLPALICWSTFIFFGGSPVIWVNAS